jgi:hypothetical protein
MDREQVGIISYNFYGGYVNYGAVLQSYALQKVLDDLSVPNIIVDYVSENYRNINMGIPVDYMRKEGNGALLRWFINARSMFMVDRKFKSFIKAHCRKTVKTYTKDDFNELTYNTYICGSDTIWNIRESKGFDDGFWANYDCMKGSRNIAYSPSLADVEFSPDEEKIFIERLNNFSTIGLREPTYIDFIKANTNVDVQWTLDPTLLLDASVYDKLTRYAYQKKKYLLLYTRSRDKEIVCFADRIAKKYGLKVIEISLQAQHAYKHKMAYNTGIEEFLALVRDAVCVVTNSFHGTIFSILYAKEFYTFVRPRAGNKNRFLLKRLGLESQLKTEQEDAFGTTIDYDAVDKKLAEERVASMTFLKRALGLYV